MIIQSAIGDWILDAILDALWYVFLMGPLQIINIFNEIFHYLSGEFIQQLIFKQNNKFSWSNIPAAFWGFGIFAAIVICFIFWSQYIILLFSDTKEVKNKFVNSIKMTGLAAVIIFFIPIGFFILNQIIIFFTANIDNIFSMPKTGGLAGILWNIGDPNWNGVSSSAPSDFGPPDNIIHYDFIVELFAVWFLLIALGMVSIIIIQKNIELFFLFIISPIVAATLASDHGKRMSTWKDSVIAKSIASTATIVSYYTFLLVISLVINLDLSRFGTVGHQIVLVALICGGALACYNSSNIVSSLVGEGVGMREGLSSFQSMMGMVAGLRTAGRGAKMLLGGNKRKLTEDEIKQQQKNNNEEENDKDENSWKVPRNPLSNRSGAVGFLGRLVDHGTDALYSVRHPKITGKRKWNKLKNAVVSSFPHKTWQARKEFENNRNKNIETTQLKVEQPSKEQSDNKN